MGGVSGGLLREPLECSPDERMLPERDPERQPRRQTHRVSSRQTDRHRAGRHRGGVRFLDTGTHTHTHTGTHAHTLQDVGISKERHTRRDRQTHRHPQRTKGQRNTHICTLATKETDPERDKGRERVEGT